MVSECQWTSIPLFLPHIYLQTNSTCSETTQPQFYLLFPQYVLHWFVNMNSAAWSLYTPFFCPCWNLTRNAKTLSIKLILLGLCIYSFTNWLWLSFITFAFFLATGCPWEVLRGVGAREGSLCPVHQSVSVRQKRRYFGPESYLLGWRGLLCALQDVRQCPQALQTWGRHWQCPRPGTMTTASPDTASCPGCRGGGKITPHGEPPL